MSIIQIKSENTDFSHIINKNPSSGLMAKSIRKGTVFCFYTKGSEQSFNIYFKDANDEVSFPAYEGEEFEYLNTTRFNSGFFVTNAINEVLRSAFKSDKYNNLDGEKIDKGGYESKFFINMIYIKNNRYIDVFEDYFPDYKVDSKIISGKNYQITITTKNSIYELLNFSILFGMFQSLVNGEPIFISDENVEKYVNCMNVIDAPYFLRYLFKIRFIRGMSNFKKFKEELSKNKKKYIEMKFGTTWQSRQIEIENRLEFNNNIIEIGCGEGKVITRMNRYMKDLKYFAIDIDEEIIEKAKKRIKRKGLKNVKFFKSVNEFLKSDDNKGKFDVILTEVIEHMSVNDARKLIELVVSKVDFNEFIITTPNEDFNKNYFIDGLRHSDHKFEHSRSEFESFINEISSGYNVETDFFDIGDIVDGDSPSQGVIFKKII